MRRGQERIAGYHEQIHRGIWERITSMGAPRTWGTLWLVVCLYAALLFLYALGIKWVLIPLVVWIVGQGVLVWLTQFDQHWDDVALAHLSRKYKSHYEAG